MPPYGELTATHSRFRGIMGRGSRDGRQRISSRVSPECTLLDMAEAWLRLAEITENGEAPTERPRASDHAQWLGAIIASSPRSPGLPVWSNRGRDGFFGAS
jgi:hypothetical protein